MSGFTRLGDGMRRLLQFTLVGLIAQLVDGALGMAFGVTASTLLVATGSSAVIASASVHLSEVGTTLVSGISHWRFGNVHWPTVKWIAIPGAVGAYFGASALSNIDGALIKPWIAALLLGLGLFLIIRFAFEKTRKPLAPEHARPKFLAPLGLLGGFVDAIGGGGWGPITTPALLTVGKMAPRRAIGSVSASEFLVSLAASIGFLTNLGSQGIDARIVAGLLAGGLVTAPLAAWVVSRLDIGVLGTAVGGLIVVVNLRTLLMAADIGGAALGVAVGAAILGSALMISIARKHAAAHAASELEAASSAAPTDQDSATREPVPA